MKPEYFQTFVESVTNILAQDDNYMALAAGGSWIDGRMDAYSDIDLVVVHQSETLALEQKQGLANRAGELLASFTGEHVGEPRLLICLYDNPMLHVDIKFVHFPDMKNRVEDPIVIWERDQSLSKILSESTAMFPYPDFQWIEDRLWVWVHYAAAKIGRGEIIETLTFLSFIQQTVLGPLALMKNGELPKGVRKLEILLPESDLRSIESTISAAKDKASCLWALQNVVKYYTELRDAVIPPTIIRNVKAEKAVMDYVSKTGIL
jgi:hypothetical protein